MADEVHGQAGPAGAGFENVGLAIAAIVIGAAAGGAVVCLVLAAAHGMMRGPDQPFADVALGGAAAGLMVAAGTAFTIGRKVGTWRALLMAISAVAGSALVTVLTLPADMVFGRAGLLALAALCGAVILGARRVFFRHSLTA